MVKPATEAFQPAGPVDRIVVEKEKRTLVLMSRGKPVREYRISLGPTPRGHKQREGDGRTPEGSYLIDWRNPKSAYHLSLHISYPDANDRETARRNGFSPGGDIMIHGQPNSLGESGRIPQEIDWTAGCIAVSNGEIREIWSLVKDGTPIEIKP